MDDDAPDPLEETRPPSDEDLARLADSLNDLGAKYIVIGGFCHHCSGLHPCHHGHHREKDALDRVFLRKLLEDRGEWPVA